MRRLSNPLVLALVGAFLAIAAGRAAAVTYIIEVQYGGPGTVTPSGVVEVPAGGSQTFTFTPGGCYGVVDVTVDDVSVGSGLTEYTFTNVQSDHVLYVSFGPHPTTTTLDLRPVFGQCAVPETLTATVPNADGGQVQFFNGGALLGTATVTAGVAAYIVAPGLPTGSYAFTANYLGASCAYPSSSPTVLYDVADTGPTPVTLSLTLFSDTLDQHALVSATTTLRIGGAVVGAQNGQVLFYDGPNLLGTFAMENGHSSWSFQMNSPGVHVLTAAASLHQCPGLTTSEPETLFVRESTSMTLTITPMQVNPGESVLMTAVVSLAGRDGIPDSSATGSIHFLDVTATPVEVGTASLVDGVASFTYGPLSGPSRVVMRARYNGDGVLAGCTSDQVALQVGESTSMTFTITPTQVDPGESVLMTAVVSPSSATGSIHFLDVTATPVEVGTASLVDGVASFTYGPLSVPGGMMQARYDGDAVDFGCTSNQVVLLVGHETTPVPSPYSWAADGSVLAIVPDGNTIYIGGNFTQVGPAGGPMQPRNHIAALDAATGTVTNWNPNANGTVEALAVSGGTVYAGGSFSSIGGQPRGRIAALDQATGAATAWDPNATGGVAPHYGLYVSALVVSGNTVYVGGSFDGIGGQARSCIAALDAASGAATAWNPNATGGDWFSGVYLLYVHNLAVSGGTVYAGGKFHNIGGQPRGYLAALDAETGAATSWHADVGSLLPSSVPFIHALAVSGGTVYVGGGFSTIRGSIRGNVAALDATTGAVTAWDPSAGGANVLALAVSGGGTVYAGGSFSIIGVLPRNNLAALHPVVGAATPWNPNANDMVFALAVSGGALYAGGDFTSMGGQPQLHIAAFSLNNTPVATPLAEPPLKTDLRFLSANPSSGGAQVQYRVARTGRVRLEVLDVTGRIEETLADRIHTTGRYVVTWDGVGRRGRVSPGLYFVRLVAPDQVTMRKLAIIQ